MAVTSKPYCWALPALLPFHSQTMTISLVWIDCESMDKSPYNLQGSSWHFNAGPGNTHPSCQCVRLTHSNLLRPTTLLTCLSNHQLLAAELFQLSLLGTGMHCQTMSSQHHVNHVSFQHRLKTLLGSSASSAVSSSVNLVVVVLITYATTKIQTDWLTHKTSEKRDTLCNKINKTKCRVCRTLTAASEPSALKSSYFMTSAIMNPFSKSVWILPAAWGAFVPLCSDKNTFFYTNLPFFHKLN